MLKQIAKSLPAGLIFGLLLFGAAGTLEWPQAWVFLAIFFACALAIGRWLQKTNPDLLAERMKSPLAGGQRSADRTVAVVMGLVFVAWLVFMGLDARRYHWSATPLWAKALGGLLIIIAFIAWSRVLRANAFAATSVRVQAERGQTVISTGPYAVVRHPMYADALFLFVGVPLLLGSLWGLAWLALFIPLLALRALGEEAVLMDGLPGYRDYAAKVRSRLLPGIW